MTKLRISPSNIQGNIEVPPSKSHTLRALLFAALADGRSEIRHPLHSPDATAMVNAMRSFGAQFEIAANDVRVQGLSGKLLCAENVIDAGNSGIVLRFVGALAALSPSYTILTGDDSIRHSRPVKPLLDALSQLGAFAVSSRQDGYAPIVIRGPIQPGHASFSGEDSQPVSALLIALSLLHGKSTLEVTRPGEKPWIDLTLHWLKKWGIAVTHEDYTRYTIAGNAKIAGFSYTVPGDFSSAAFPLAAALVTGSELTLSNLDMEDCQGDKQVIAVLKQMGAEIEVDAGKKIVHCGKSPSLRGCRIDINDFIDALPILSVIGCYAHGKTEIVGAAIARRKESDRVHAIATELKKMGALIEEKPDGLIVAHSPLRGAHLTSWHDHRIAMSLAIAALGAQGDTHIDAVECIVKTYPTFAHDMRGIGAKMETLS